MTNGSILMEFIVIGVITDMMGMTGINKREVYIDAESVSRTAEPTDAANGVK